MNRSRLLISTALAGGLLLSGGMSTTAWAQAAKPAADVVGTPEVVVTARKREEKLTQVPLSVQAFSADQISAKHIENIQTLQSQAGFTLLGQVSTGAGGRTQGELVFRGLQGVTFTLGQQSSGSLFIDGIFVSGAPQSVVTTDVDRIEVLKGPQNAYFGRSTFGGAVNFITRKPSDKLAGEVNLSATVRGAIEGDGTIEGPLIKGVLDGRVTVYDHITPATFHASDGGDLGAEKTKGIIATVMYTPNENLWIKSRVNIQEESDSTADNAFISALYNGPNNGPNTSCTGKTFHGTDAQGNYLPVTLNTFYFCGGIPTMSQLSAHSINGVYTLPIDASTTIPANEVQALKYNTLHIRYLSKTPRLDHSGMERSTYRGSFQGGYKLPYNANLDFNIGYNLALSTYAFDIDHSAVNDFFNVFANVDEDFTADLRLSSDQSQRIRGLVGVSYFKSRNAQDRLDNNLAFGSPLNESNFLDNRNETPSIYGSVDFDILSFLTATVEGRYESEQDSAFQANGTRINQNFKSFLPRYILKYHPNDNFDAYISYSEGAQPATLNNSYVIANAAQRAYINTIDPSQSLFSVQPQLKSWEIGLKQRLFGGRLEYAVAAYQENWIHELTSSFIKNSDACTLAGLQFTTACPLSIAGSSLLLANNARVRGVEFQSTGHVTPNIDLSVTLDFKDAVWLQYYNAGLDPFAGTVSHFNGNHLSRVPDLQATYSAVYHKALNDVWSMHARTDISYTGSAWDTDINIVKTTPYYRVSSALGVERRDLSVELFVTNLLNDQTWNYVSKVPDVTEFTFAKQGVLVQPAPPREVGVRLKYKFN